MLDLSSTHTVPRGHVDHITWLLVEARGPRGAHAGRYDLSTLTTSPDGSGRAVLLEGALDDPLGPNLYDWTYRSERYLVRDDVEPDAAVAAARDGVAVVARSVDRATADLSGFRVSPGERLPRHPESLEIVLRRSSGARERYVVPTKQQPASLADARAAINDLANTLATNFVRLDPPPAAARG